MFQLPWQGPDAVPPAAFTADLREHHIRYRTERIGPVTAVIPQL